MMISDMSGGSQLQEEDEVSGEPQKKEKIIEESKTFEVLPWGPEPTREEDDNRSN
jgi:hypothetical protein